MRRSICFGLAALAPFLLAMPVQAQVDVTGTWEITTVTQRGERTMTFTFQQEGTTFTGSTEFAPMGRGGGVAAGGPREIPISNGKVEGDKISFDLVMGMGERTMTQTFTGTVTGDTIEGTMTGGMQQTAPIPFTGKRKTG